MKLAVAQNPPAGGNLDAIFAGIERDYRGSCALGATVLVLPELVLPGYNCPELHAALSQPIDGPWITRLRAMVRDGGCALVFGWAEREGDRVYNAATVIGPEGEILAHYRKIQLYGEMERASFCHGETLPAVFELGGRACALLICYDIEFPGHAAALGARGAEVVFVPTANPAGFEHVQSVLVPARAFENAMTVAYANFCGLDNGLAFGGHSVIAGPDGKVLAEAGPSPALLVVDLPKLDSYPAHLLSSQRQDYRAAGPAS